MNYVIWGAGSLGEKAFHFLGPLRVRCFIDNKIKGSVLDREVYTFEDYIERYFDENDVIVVASFHSSFDIEEELKKRKIRKYFLFGNADDCEIKKVLPFSVLHRKRIDYDYSTIISHYNLNKAKRVSILGVNRFVHYLICELKFQMNDTDISLIDEEGVQSCYCMDCEVVSFEKAYKESDYIIINKTCSESDVRYEILEKGLDRSKFIDIYDVDKFEPSFMYYSLKKLYKQYNGRRIFLIGNGPSLEAADLDILAYHNELCIGCNKIYKIFDKTNWRPDILVVSDADYIERFQRELDEVKTLKIVANHFHRNSRCDRKMDVFSFIHLKEESYGENHPQFSDDICKGVFLGYTVIYDIALQLAVYMGASEIILLGVDMDNFGRHFCEDYYMGEENEVLNKAVNKEKYFKPFETARAYAERNDIRIKNATRGGELEIFDRVDFDSLFQNRG